MQRCTVPALRARLEVRLFSHSAKVCNGKKGEPSRPRQTLDQLASHPSVSAVLTASRERARKLRSHLDTRLATASEQWNNYSGYAAVEQLKLRITHLETALSDARSTLDSAKHSYINSVAARSSSQKEINDLLSRKSVWTDADLHRYTELLRQEHRLYGDEQRGETELEHATAHVQSAFDQLMKTVLLRYHEEQIWSDRVRSWSTWGSFLVAGLNASLFLLAILLVEPLKRKKLAQTFESRLLQGEQQSRTLILHTIAEFEHKLEQFAVAAAQPHAITTLPQPQQQQQPDETSVQHGLPAPAPVPAPAPNDGPAHKPLGEDIVYATTIGVVAGALLSTLLSFCSR